MCCTSFKIYINKPYIIFDTLDTFTFIPEAYKFIRLSRHLKHHSNQMTLTRYIACNITAIVFGVIGFVGNALVCHVIVRLKTMKTSINYIILNLAVLDAMTAVLSMSYVFVRDNQGVFGESLLSQAYNQSSTLADVICKVQWTVWFPFNVSPLLLMIMAYERFKAIVDPLSRLDDTATKARLKWMIPLSWMLGAMYFIIDLFVLHYDAKESFCHFVYVNMPPWFNHKIVLGAYLITQGIIPSIAMLVFYGRIICALRKQNVALGPQAEAERARRKARKKVTWVIVVVTLVFYICCGIPNVFYILHIIYEKLLRNAQLMSDIEMVLLTFNAAFNPFVYFTFMQSFRDGFRRVFLSRPRISPPGLELDGRQGRSTLGNDQEHI